MKHNVVIIGAGPAGMSAAATLVKQGIHPVVVDANSKSGGQIYRQQPDNFTRTKKQLYGFDAKEATQALKNWVNIEDKITYLPCHMVWNASGKTLCLYDETNSAYKEIEWDSLIIATGATDRILPFKGWTLPGIYTLGAAQIALKNQGCTIGNDIVIAGNGPLLYLLAWQYVKAGANIKAILDYSSFTDQCKASLKLIHAPKVMLKGLYYLASLKCTGIKIIHNARLNEAESGSKGEEKVTGIKWHTSKSSDEIHHITCDAIAFGYGLRSETQLADVLGCKFSFDPIHHDWLPVLNEQQTSIPDVYMTGDNSGISGVYSAQFSGKKAANQILNKLGLPVSDIETKKIDQQLNHLKTFSNGLAQAFPFPEQWAQDVSDDTIICRCENITAGDIRAAIKDKHCTEINQLKAHSRSGMGRCQGRVCHIAVRELLACETKNQSANVGRIRSQSPLKPIPIVVTEELVNETH